MTVLNKRLSGIPEDSVYIGRGSMWGNTFTYIPGIPGTVLVKDRDAACDAFAIDLKRRIRAGEVTIAQLASLHGWDLVCHCAPLRCHGETLEKVAAWACKKLQTEPVKSKEDSHV